MRLLFTSAEPQSAKVEATNAADTVKKYMQDFTDTDVMVSAAPIERLHDKYRWHVVVKYSTTNDDAHEALHSAVDEILDMNEFSVVRIAVDFAPVSLL